MSQLSTRFLITHRTRYRYSDFDNPRYYNIRWLKLLEEAERVLGVPGALFGLPGHTERGAGIPHLRGVA